jgi:hypothetical protein
MAQRLLGAVCTAAFLITGAHAQISGAIYTSKADGSIPNANIYPSKDAVYLNGGPQNENSAGLPPGHYYFQVTDPSGVTLLSTDDIRNRRVLVALNSNGKGVVSGPLADPNDPLTYPGHAPGTFNPANGSTPVQLMDYDDTPNNGGEYKVWLTPVDAYSPGSGTNGFISSQSKTDNFKVRDEDPPTPQAFMAGVKYLDLDMDGARDAGEPLLHNWEITIITPGDTYIVTTNIAGEWGLELPQGTTYEACETQQPGWIQTGPVPGATIFFNGNVIATADANQCWEGTVPVADPGTIIFGHDFGNINVVPISGTKFEDVNANHMWDAGEPTIAGVEVTITGLRPDNTPINETVVTDANGVWTSTPQPIGSTFEACETVPANMLQTSPEPGAQAFLHGTVVGTADANRCWTGVFTLIENPQTLQMDPIVNLDFGNVRAFRITGEKFYDLNVNGVKDAGEVPIEGFRIQIDTVWPDGSAHSEVVVTDANGQFESSLIPATSTFSVCEILPLDHWFQTGPVAGAQVSSNGETATADAALCWIGAVPQTGNFDGLYFGNVCLGEGGGKTLGFWSNRNGERRMSQTLGMANALAGLSAQNLRKANGNDFDPATYRKFRDWLLEATATNMAYMLSAQYAAMWLNVNAVSAQWPGVDPNSMIYAPGTNSANALGFATIAAVMAEANAELGLHGTAFMGDAWRAYQEALKNALDRANNNLNFVQPEPCEVEYPQ